MAINTLKTTLGFMATMLRKSGLIKLESDTLEGIYNYVPISGKISTSGQPSPAELQMIKTAGFDAIINLAPHNAENALDDEVGVVAGLGLEYIHIPVDFKNPTDSDFSSFVNTMADMEGREVWVHCAANMRVSAFIYRYRRQVLGVDREIAQEDLQKIWEPFGVWKIFVNQDNEVAGL
jgi:protein tyrosine phosphatase (PTP) superfamily phosphohydrolase (DUF442 family)